MIPVINSDITITQPVSRKPCACGSIEHQRTISRSCILNKKNNTLSNEQRDIILATDYQQTFNNNYKNKKSDE